MPARRVLRVLIILLCAVLLILSPSQTVSGDDAASITVSATTLAKIAIGAAAQYVVKNSNQWPAYESVMALSVLSEAEKAATNSGAPLSTADANAILTGAKSLLDQQTTQVQTLLDKGAARVIGFATDELFSLPAQMPGPLGAIVAKALDKLGKDKVDELKTKLDLTLQKTADEQISQITTNANEYLAQHIQEIFDLVQNNAQLAPIVDPILKTLVRCTTSCSFSDLQANFPFLDVIPKLSLSSDGSLTFNPSALEGQVQSIANTIMCGADPCGPDSTQGTVADLNDLRNVSDYQLANLFPVDPSTNPSPVPSDITYNPDDHQAQRQKALDAALSSVTSLSHLIGLADPQLGRQVQVVGEATIQISEDVSKFLRTTENLTASSADLFAGVALTGNIAGAAVSIFSLFEGGDSLSGGPSPDLIILEQLKALSQQIDQLHKDMDNRFNRVDAQLNTILTTMKSNFDDVINRLDAIRRDLHKIEANLLDIQDQLNRLEQYTLLGDRTLSEEGFRSDTNLCLDYRRTHNGGDIGKDQYNYCENKIYTWAHDTAVDPLWAPADPLGLGYSDASMYPTLSDTTTNNDPNSAVPPPAAVNYLAQFSEVNFGKRLADSLLVNPVEWQLGARAYLQLASEWPQYARNISSSRVHDLSVLGDALQRAAANITTTNNGGVVTPDTQLFDKLMDKYRNKLDSVRGAIQSIIDAYLKDKFPQHADLWGGHNQSPKYTPSFVSNPMPQCDSQTATQVGAVQSYPVPAGLQGLFSSPVILGEQLGLGSISVCLQFANIHLSLGCCTGPEFPYGAGHQYVNGIWREKIIGAVNGSLVLSKYYDVPCGYHFPCVLNLGYWFSDMALGVFFGGPDDFAASWAGIGQGDPNCPQPGPSGIGPFCVSGLSGDNFVANAVDDPSAALEISGNLMRISDSVDALLAKDQQNLYGLIASDSGVQGSERELTGAKLLIQAYVNLGLLAGLQGNDYVRSLLYGEQSILDGSMIQSDLAAFASQPVPDPTHNRIYMDEYGKMNFQGAAPSFLAATVSTIVQKQSPQSLDQIDITLEDLRGLESQLNASLKDPEVLSPCRYQLCQSACPSPASVRVNGMGGNGTIGIQEPNGCQWTASTGNNWLRVTSSPGGNGNGSVTYSIDPNPGSSPRDAIFVVGDQIFHVSEGAGPFSATPSPTVTTTPTAPTTTPTATPGPTSTPTPTATPVTAVLAVSPRVLSFVKQRVNTVSKVQNVVLTNKSKALPITVEGFIIPGQFTVTVTQCQGVTLRPKKSCKVRVQFAPTAKEKLVERLIVQDNTTVGSHTVRLVGQTR